MILKLIDSDNLDQAIASIRDALQEDFHADAVELVLFDCASRAESVAHDDERLKPFQRIMQSKYPVCGHFSSDQMRLLFGKRGEEIASAVVVPLCEGEHEPCLGLLGIGSIDPKRYHPDMGTVFVSHLGAVMNREEYDLHDDQNGTGARRRQHGWKGSSVTCSMNVASPRLP